MESPVVTSAEMRAAEEAAFARGLTAEALMDDAATGIARAISKFFPQAGHAIVFAGKGNNAGDSLAAARLLQDCGWTIELRLAFPEEECGELARKKLRSLSPPKRNKNAHRIVLDGLLGLGAKPPLREPIASASREINRLRREEGAFVFAIDLPTGLDGDTGDADPDCVIADFTLTIGYAKRGLLADRALDHVGRIERIPLVELASSNKCGAALADGASLRGLLPRRGFGGYKNQFGRVGVVAGSRGLTGAAILCATGALRGGAGLLELFVPQDIYAIVASAAPPEAIVKPISSHSALLEEESIDVWAIGPGLGQEHADEIRKLIERAPQPIVIDADALNVLAHDPSILNNAAGPRLLTPHPGEMKRLFPNEKKTRAEQATQFCAKYPVTLLLKGSRTVVAERDRPLSYNTTGNPGMATGGMGDVLTGVCAALLAQRLAPFDAARVGAWVCGRAAEIAIFQGNASEQSLLPSDLLDNLGTAFRQI